MVKPPLSLYLFALRFTSTQRYILFFSFAISIVLLWYILFCIPLDTKIKKLQKKIDLLTITINQTPKKIAPQGLLHSSCDTITDFLKLIREHNISLESLEQQEESQGRLKINISLSSSFHDLESFFKEFISFFSYTLIESVDVSASKKNPSLVSCLLVFSLCGDKCEAIS